MLIIHLPTDLAEDPIFENGSEIEVSTNYFSFSPVSDMYRTQNFRTGGSSSTGEPANWPDELTNGKDFVFVHGYNVDETKGGEWNGDICKRLWHSGSNAKFHGIIWDGTPENEGFLNFGYSYHNAVINAFATAPDFSAYLDGLNEPVVMAHSLGNIVTSEAITGDHGLTANKVVQYYAMDAAVALEAYGDTAPISNLIPGTRLARNATGFLSFRGYEWMDYPSEMRPYRWYELFGAGDARSGLTWRNRFVDVQDKTDVFNFYSSTEDVLRVGDDHTTFLSTVQLGGDSFLYIPASIEFHAYAWQIQEIYKGRGFFFDEGLFPGLAGGGSSDYAGWDFVKESDNHYVDVLGVNLWPVNARKWQERLAPANPTRSQWLDVVRDDPLFQHTPSELFGGGSESFAAGTVATHGGSLDYNTANDTVPTDDVPIRDWLLAKAFPGTTSPLGFSLNNADKWETSIAPARNYCDAA